MNQYEPSYQHWLNQPGNKPDRKEDTYMWCGMGYAQLKSWAVPNTYFGEDFYLTQPSPLPFQVLGRN